MKRFSFGKVEMKVSVRDAEPGFKEYIVRVSAPEVDPFTFHTFRETSIKPQEGKVARTLMMEIRWAWTNPSDYIYHKVRKAAEDVDPEDAERVAATTKKEAIETAQFAADLDPYMAGVENALWESAGVPMWGDPIVRSPREWLPPRKKS